MRTLETPVLVVGGGPVGLSTALHLAHQGVESILVERNPTTSSHPKASYFNVRTMEILQLLDSYHEERRPIATYNVEASRENALRIRETGASLDETTPDVDEVDRDTPRGRAQRERLSNAIAAQRSHFLFLGQEIGFDYASSSLITQDGTPHYVLEHGVEDPIFTYVPNARPGARAPHCWLAPRGESEVRPSTLALFDREFVLLVAGDPAAWSKALDSCDEDIPVRVAAIGPPGSGSEWEDVEGTFRQRYGIGDGGAVLVRPDGHVAWRAAEDPEYHAGLPLSEALEIAVGRRAPEAPFNKEKTT